MIAFTRKAYLTLLFLILALRLDAQLGSQSLAANNPDFSHQYTFLNQEDYYFIDTSFNSQHWYHQFNHTGKDLFGFARLGNMGAALNPLLPEVPIGIWQYYHMGAYRNYFKSQKDIPLYYVRSALTEATYWMGYERGQSFNFYHTQNISKDWNFLVNFKNLNALGKYTHNLNRHFTLLANTHYLNKKQGYEFYAHLLIENLKNDENGGLSNDSIFEENLATAIPRRLLAVNLNGDRRLLKSREFVVHQQYDLAKFLRETDTIAEEPLAEKAYLKVGHELRIAHKSMAYRGNSQSDFYPNYFFQEGAYADTSGYRSVENTAFLNTEVGQKSKVALKAGIKNLTTVYGNNQFRFTTSNWGLISQFSANLSKRAALRADLDYIFIGPLDQSLDINSELMVQLYQSLHLTGDFDFKVRNPLFYQSYYVSNNYIWENNFDKEIYSGVSAGLKWSQDNYLKLVNQTFSKRIYFNQEALPQQADDLVNVLSLRLQQNFDFWDFLYLDNNLVYQNSDNQGVLPLPEVVGRHSLYFKFNLFGKALTCMAGGEVNYFTRYDSPSYNPATGVFYNASEKEIGDYPLVDLFANFKLRKTLIFVKMEHANQGINAYRYYAAPNYPFPDRTLRVGISWRFFN